MKIKISLLLLFCLFTGREMLAQEIDISGTWTMYEMIWSTGDDVNKTTEEQLLDQGMTSEYDLMPDGKVKLVSNMTGSGNMETVEGTWKLDGDKLIFSFFFNDNPMELVWDFEYKDGCFHLKRTSPDGSTSVVNSFKRKKPEV